MILKYSDVLAVLYQENSLENLIRFLGGDLDKEQFRKSVLRKFGRTVDIKLLAFCNGLYKVTENEFETRYDVIKSDYVNYEKEIMRNSLPPIVSFDFRLTGVYKREHFTFFYKRIGYIVDKSKFVDNKGMLLIKTDKPMLIKVDNRWYLWDSISLEEKEEGFEPQHIKLSTVGFRSFGRPIREWSYA